MLYILALIKAKSVNSSDIATVLNPHAKKKSNQRRIENFFAKQEINYKIIALIALTILPVKKYKISIEIKKHGYKQYSYVKYGLDIMSGIIGHLHVKATEFANVVILFSMNGFENSLSELLE